MAFSIRNQALAVIASLIIVASVSGVVRLLQNGQVLLSQTSVPCSQNGPDNAVTYNTIPCPQQVPMYGCISTENEAYCIARTYEKAIQQPGVQYTYAKQDDCMKQCFPLCQGKPTTVECDPNGVSCAKNGGACNTACYLHTPVSYGGGVGGGIPSIKGETRSCGTQTSCCAGSACKNETGGDAYHDGICVSPKCGNGITDPGEECDDGEKNGKETPGCTEHCNKTNVCFAPEKEENEGKNSDGTDIQANLLGEVGTPDKGGVINGPLDDTRAQCTIGGCTKPPGTKATLGGDYCVDDAYCALDSDEKHSSCFYCRMTVPLQGICRSPADCRGAYEDGVLNVKKTRVFCKITRGGNGAGDGYGRCCDGKEGGKGGGACGGEVGEPPVQDIPVCNPPPGGGGGSAGSKPSGGTTAGGGAGTTAADGTGGTNGMNGGQGGTTGGSGGSSVTSIARATSVSSTSSSSSVKSGSSVSSIRSSTSSAASSTVSSTARTSSSALSSSTVSSRTSSSVFSIFIVTGTSSSRSSSSTTSTSSSLSTTSSFSASSFTYSIPSSSSVSFYGNSSYRSDDYYSSLSFYQYSEGYVPPEYRYPPGAPPIVIAQVPQRFVPQNCGDGFPNPGEQCDDGVENSNRPTAHCRSDCRLAGCGDGITDTPRETCDDGNGISGDGCSDICQYERAAPNILPSNVLQLPLMPGQSYPLSGPTIGYSPYTPPQTTQSGPAALAVMAAGASAGFSWMKRRRK